MVITYYSCTIFGSIAELELIRHAALRAANPIIILKVGDHPEAPHRIRILADANREWPHAFAESNSAHRGQKPRTALSFDTRSTAVDIDRTGVDGRLREATVPPSASKEVT
ncbi:hypothetical protein R1flu_019565 [Riccia fluitans]|uniref:Uncharacterized protein n=1 Tax=Riccia fluitans TaxID=41844 RepID=A0ABD1ZJ05_9MARC